MRRTPHSSLPLDWTIIPLLGRSGLGRVARGVVRVAKSLSWKKLGGSGLEMCQKFVCRKKYGGLGSDLLSECSSAGAWPDVHLMGPWEVEAWWGVKPRVGRKYD